MEKFFLASYIFFQGLLAGFSMALVYVVEQTDTDFDLLVNYQPSSNEIRRILFIFGAISCVGALELFTNSLRRRRYLSNASPGEAASSRDKDGRSSTATTGTGFSQVQLEGYIENLCCRVTYSDDILPCQGFVAGHLGCFDLLFYSIYNTANHGSNGKTSRRHCIRHLISLYYIVKGCFNFEKEWFR